MTDADKIVEQMANIANSLEEKLTTQMNNLETGLTTQINELDVRLTGEMEGLKSEVGGLRAEVGELKDDVRKLNQRVAVIEVDHGKKLDTLFDSYSSLHNLYEQQGELISDIHRKVVNNENKITALTMK